MSEKDDTLEIDPNNCMIVNIYIINPDRIFMYSVGIDDSDFNFSGMGHPAVKRLMDKTVRSVGLSVIDQPADNTQTSVRITLFEKERIGCKIAVQFDFTRM